MDMREKIARAIDPPAFAEGTDKTHWQMAALEVADRVLDAMREPTEEMVIAGIIQRHDSETPEAWKLATANIYTAMLTAARTKETA